VLALSDELDDLGLTGDNTGANPNGLLTQLTDPDDPNSVVDFDGFMALAAGGINGGRGSGDVPAVPRISHPPGSPPVRAAAGHDRPAAERPDPQRGECLARTD